MGKLIQTAPVDSNGRQVQKFMDQYEFQVRNISSNLETDPEYILSVHTDGGFVVQKHYYSSPTQEEMLYYIEKPGRDPRTVWTGSRASLEYLDFHPAIAAAATRVI